MSKQTSDRDYVWWLIPGKLAGMPRPQLADLPELQRSGIKGIVSVMDEPSGIKEYQEQGFQALWLPITGGKPPTVEQVRQFVNFAEPIIEGNRSVVVHCTSGNRRTGTLLAAYLIAKGENPQQAIARVQKARSTAELREAQRNFLLQLPELLTN
ncbi:MAG: dual specificity protein phosphatase family protein [Pleurocapsa sp. MO_226.B13]|nr:dual specificity protein phosphatase family protein [Pleurocapsa sp. MO_226.B13]